MAHLAAFSITHSDILYDSKIAPDGQSEDSASDSASSEISFDAGKHAKLKPQLCDLSTDDDASTDQSDDFATTIPTGTRLSIFQQVCQQSDSKAMSTKEDGQADGSLLKLMNLDTQQDFEETWSQSSVEQLVI